jgi:hypothetical protein
MTEAVRFYWRDRDASIPLDAIPEQDRRPLRVRRSSVQSYAPDVIEQLEAGRFVAAVWETDGQIYLILCHPSLDKGSADTALMNTTALPRVVLKLSGWDQAPEMTRLFLRAFGSEAANADECTTARRELASWLTANGQPGTANLVRHYSVFPFGVRSNIPDVINVWRNLLIKGQREQLDRLLNEVEQRFSAFGWSRDVSMEAQMNRPAHQVNRVYCWRSTPDAPPQILLCLNRASDRRIRGGTYDMDPVAKLTDLASAIQNVLKEVIEPATDAVGSEVTYPRLGPISRVGLKTEAAMTAFARSGDGQWPVPEHVAPLWRNVVLTAFREDVALKPQELTAWFVSSGWDEPAAGELARQFYGDIALLAEHEEAERQPA